MLVGVGLVFFKVAVVCSFEGECAADQEAVYGMMMTHGAVTLKLTLTVTFHATCWSWSLDAACS